MKDQTWRQHFGSLDRPVTTRDLLIVAELLFSAIEEAKTHIMASIDDLISEVNDETTVTDSVVTLLNNIETQLKNALANSVPPAVAQKIDQAFATLKANKQKLADAITANTPVDNGGGDQNTDTESGGVDGGDAGDTGSSNASA